MSKKSKRKQHYPNHKPMMPYNVLNIHSVENKKIINAEVKKAMDQYVSNIVRLCAVGFCLSLNVEYEFGAKRLEKVLATFNKFVTENITTYTEDDVLNEMIDRHIAALKIGHLL